MRANLGISGRVLPKVFIELQKDDKDLLQSLSLYFKDSSINFEVLFISFVAKLAKVKEVIFADFKPAQCIADIKLQKSILLQVTLI